MYGPAYELQVRSVESADSEKYAEAETYGPRHWQRDREDSLYDFIARLNRIRRQNRALRTHGTLRFHATDNEHLICYSKQAADNAVLTVVNLDPHHPQAGWLAVSGETFGLPAGPFPVHDLISDARFTWQGSRHFVALDPQVCPAHVFRLSPS
jgi:starch synthase (maltosyl-transferring)